MMVEKGEEMVRQMKQNPALFLKLTAASVGFSVAVAKLQAYQRDVVSELSRDLEYFTALENAYGDSADIDLQLAEELEDLSSEVDEILFDWRTHSDEQ